MYDQAATEKLERILAEKVSPFTPEIIIAVKDAILQGADPAVMDRTPFGNTALINAIIDDEIELASFLIEQDREGKSLQWVAENSVFTYNTPLMLAIKKGHYDIALKLVEKHACPDVSQMKATLSPLHIAILNLGEGIMETSFGKKNQNSFFAAKETLPVPLEKQKQLISELIKEGSYLNVKDEFGKTAMEYLQQPLSKDDLLSITLRISLRDYLDLPENSDVLKEKEALLVAFYNSCREIDDDFSLGYEEYNLALERLKQESDPDIVNYVNFKEKAYSVEEIITNPFFGVDSSEVIKKSNEKFNCSYLPKGGDKNVSQTYTAHMDGHQNFDLLIEKRNAYLNTADCLQFCDEIRQSVDHPKKNI